MSTTITAHEVICSQIWGVDESRPRDVIARDIIGALRAHSYEIVKVDGVERQELEAFSHLDWGGAEIDTSNIDDVAEWAWLNGWDRGWNACLDKLEVTQCALVEGHDGPHREAMP